MSSRDVRMVCPRPKGDRVDCIYSSLPEDEPKRFETRRRQQKININSENCAFLWRFLYNCMKLYYKHDIPPTCFEKFMRTSSGRCVAQDGFIEILQNILNQCTEIQHFISAHWFKSLNLSHHVIRLEISSE
jgi:hypothetical protein